MWGTEPRRVWANDVLTRYDGVPRERRLGLPPVTAGGGCPDRATVQVRAAGSYTAQTQVAPIEQHSASLASSASTR
ncbi:hypothetical protein [Streptomyces sp. ECR3.8]|uniref:hypothetical protein n=1 Tax=Streptomyces sp. ECR3.8 TaxID=3461009 RepID=UPI00404336F8